MMLAHENMRVVHVSTHVSLREAGDRVKKQRGLDVIRIGDRACREMGIENPDVYKRQALMWWNIQPYMMRPVRN